MNDEKQFETAYSAAEAWREVLKEKGYDPKPVTRWFCIRFAILSRAWRRILRHTGFKRFAPVRALEFGCGGAQLVPLYVNGWNCTDVDVSPEVLARAQVYIERAQKHCRPKGTIEPKCADFKDYDTESSTYDINFQFGVREYFLEDCERQRYVKKMFDATRPGGFVVAVVPNGDHAFRTEQRERGLGGHTIPKRDFDQWSRWRKHC